jgi:hypothetical protein
LDNHWIKMRGLKSQGIVAVANLGYPDTKNQMDR